MSMRFSVVCFIVSTTGSSSGSNAGVALIICLRHDYRVLTVDPLLVVHPGPGFAKHYERRGGREEPDATIDAYYYVETADDQE
ncbi:hypothetical protein TRIUR3_28298 [Triticum urartu]|uniref:Uncharacterized protein n=1 Tax=Triticum urartu TaxID=4572 RepID=M8ARK0_TRIUA|nr:hypothetical protein TRIUR3_28298 [Triticum urartu]